VLLQLAKLFLYSDTESQAIHFSEYLDPTVTLFGPGDQVTQPIFVDFPNASGACLLLNLLPDGEAVLLVLLDASVTLDVLPEAVLTLNNEDGPDLVFNVNPEASLVFNVESC
jgi:hypothetical protein